MRRILRLFHPFGKQAPRRFQQLRQIRFGLGIGGKRGEVFLPQLQRFDSKGVKIRSRHEPAKYRETGNSGLAF
jgi:hypothetical protein